MRNHNNNTNALLVEIMIAVLFFALCAVVLLQTFTGVHRQSRLAGLSTSAMIDARDMLQQLGASRDPEQLLSDCGYAPQEDGWTLQQDGCTFTVKLDRENSDHGTLVSARLTASADGEQLFALQGGRYLPGEVD